MSITEKVKNRSKEIKDNSIQSDYYPTDFLKTLPELWEVINREYDETYESIGGSSTEKFILVKGSNFKELFDELRNNSNCSYSTYLNEVIKEGYNPENVSCLIKRVRGLDFALSEVLASEIFNFFSLPVAYYTLVKDSDDFKTLSIDFLGKHERIDTLFSKIGFSISKWSVADFIDENLEGICNAVNTFYKKSKLIEDKETRDKIFCEYSKLEKEFLQMHLVRDLLLNDADYETYNVATIENKVDGYIRLAPTFDLAVSLRTPIEDERLTKTLELFSAKYPDVLEDFITKLEYGMTCLNGSNKTTFDHICLSATNNCDSICSKNIRTVLKSNASNILDKYKQMQNQSIM